MPETSEPNDQPIAQASDLDPVTAELVGQGFAVLDSYPANHRLRAEALAKAGAETDPANHITSEAIADAKVRLDAEARDAAEAERTARANTPSMDWTKPDLIAEAERRRVVLEGDPNKADILAAINAAPAVSSEG